MDHVVDGLQTASQFWSASRAPLDNGGRGHPLPPLLRQPIHDIKKAIEEGRPFSIADLPAYIDAVANFRGTIDDREFLLEKVLTLMARLGNEEISSRLQQFVIDILYKDLPHPPAAYLALHRPNICINPLINQPGDGPPLYSVDYAYRPADGSNYNPLMPTIGMAGSPYARTVPSLRHMSPAAWPPAELVFDKLLKRDKFVEHPGKISSLFFAFADIIIHNIFDTDHRSPSETINNSSSYLDLSPLYGTSQKQVDDVRLHDGTGRLKPDVFADPRLLNMPPAVCALLIIFNRNHNYVAEKILSINENRRFKFPPPRDQTARDAQDEEIFQRARLVNTGYFMQIILRDYVGAILGLTRDGSSWRLDPLAASRELDHEVSPRGQGNVVSIEFNLLYRWHATVSEADAAWTERHFKEHMNGADPRTISPKEFIRKAPGMLNPGKPITEWTFDGLKRECGRFRDDDLAKILQNATEASAGAYKARGTPEVLRVVELLSIKQGREWGICTLNEFRKFLGLKPYETFLQWNKDKEIADAAEELYHDIDNLELHVGMQAEQAKDPMPGAGLCPGYTISRAILADAVALTRGDRFMTVDFTPHNFTTWGYDDCQANTSDGSFGGMLARLLFRHLPNNYPARSAYGHFPFMVPKKMKECVKELLGDIEPKYDWCRPAVPVGSPILARTYSEVKQLFSESAFTSGVAKRLEVLTLGVHLDIPPVESVLVKQTQLDKAARAISTITRDLIAEKKSKCIMPYLDIVGQVINFIPVYWLSNYIIGLPLKTNKNPRGAFTEEELYHSFANITNYVYCNSDPSNDWFLREQSQQIIRRIEPFLKGHLVRLARGSMDFEGLTDTVLRWVTSKNDHSDEFLTDLVDATGSQSGNSALDGLVGSVLASVVPTAALFSQIIAQVVDFYIDPHKAGTREHIVQLAQQGDNARVMPFIFEALRLNPPLSSVLLEARSPTTFGTSGVAKGQHVIASVVDATRDASTFECADRPNYEQSAALVDCVLGLDHKGLLCPKLFERVAPIVLLHIFTLKNLCRYSPQSDMMQSDPMQRFDETVHDVPNQFYTDQNGRVTPFPVSLFVQFDA